MRTFPKTLVFEDQRTCLDFGTCVRNLRCTFMEHNCHNSIYSRGIGYSDQPSLEELFLRICTGPYPPDIGPAAKILAKAQIRTAFSWWRSHVLIDNLSLSWSLSNRLQEPFTASQLRATFYWWRSQTVSLPLISQRVYRCQLAAGEFKGRATLWTASACTGVLQLLIIYTHLAEMKYSSSLLALLVLAALIFCNVAVGEQPLALRLLLNSDDPSSNVLDIDRKSFPPGFVFGAASSSFQVDGAVNEGGRGTTVWDTDSRTPGLIANGDTADVACDSYHRYQEDIDILSNTGFHAYRFSIAWSRIFPDGVGKINQEGVDYYNRLIDAVIERGIEPWVTLYHWDLPQALEDSFGGWMSRQILPAFENYAETCFTLFGDRVKNWITVNEPTQFVVTNNGCKAADHICGPGNATENLYLAGHHVILAHASAVSIYRTKFQAIQKGQIGMVIDMQWWGPLTDSEEDLRTHELAMGWRYGWFLDPIVYGDYAEILKNFVGSVLPTFTAEESQLIKQSFDFLGINHYTSYYVTSKPTPDFVMDSLSFPDSASIYFGQTRNGLRIGPPAGAVWQSVVPSGMKKVLDFMRVKYGNPVIYITENGLGEKTDSSVPLSTLLKDTARIQFYHDYLSSLLNAMRDGAQVHGYFAWSLLDSFEWFDGYNVGFGLVAVDRKTMTRYAKASTGWWQGFLRADFVQRGYEQM